MMRGYADPDATHERLGRHRAIAAAALGRTGLGVGQAGFGCYRVSVRVPAHAEAVAHALASGINLIDTSANYADGESEELIGQATARLVEAGTLRRDALVVVSKAGYLQGCNFDLSRTRKRRGQPFPELVEYDEGLEHCVHPEFLDDQLTRSLARLRLETLDVYLLHNPEYYLAWAAAHDHPPREAHAEYYRRIENAFRHLETEVARGRIRWYGISSNTFPAPASDARFTCLERVWNIAESIAPEHHFAVVQFPMNLLETGAATIANQPSGTTALEFARRKNLGVLINRPLNAFAGNRLVRLAGGAGLAARRAGEIKAALAAADPDWAGDAPLSRLALRALRSTSGIACTLVGMRRIAYVDDIVAELGHPLECRERGASWRELARLL